MVELYPAIEPYERGALEVGDGHRIAWELSGNPSGKPAVVLHGGPGQGCSPNMRRAFDPRRYRIVMFDQRGCGLSVPHASDVSTPLLANTTDHLIADMEALRDHLRIEQWLLCGGSWGSTLALAYAQRHPMRVSAIVLNSVTTSRRYEAEWLYHGASRFFPEAWNEFSSHAGVDANTIVESYSQLLESNDPSVRLAAARAWCRWEDAVLSLEPNAAAGYADLPERDLLAFVRICTHYLRHHAWLEEGALIRDAHRLRGIPGVLIHGRRDMSCPADTAWELAAAWPDAELVLLDDAGHGRSDSKRRALLRALDRFAR